MKLMVEVAFDREEEHRVIGDFIHANEMWSPKSVQPTASGGLYIRKAWMGKEMRLDELEALHAYLESVVPDETLFKYCEDEEALVYAQKNAVSLRGLVYEAIRMINRTHPSSISITPGP